MVLHMPKVKRVVDSADTNVNRGWNKFFKPSVLRKNWELIPLAIVPIYAIALCTFMLYRAATIYPDVRWSNKDDQYTAPENDVRPNQRLKLKLFASKELLYQPHPELEAIKKDLTDCPRD